VHLLLADSNHLLNLGYVDYLIFIVYFAFVLGIGLLLRRYIKTGDDFLLSGRSVPAWIAGLAFISANLGAQEMIGMSASGAQYGILTTHFYWLGAIPAMVFLGIFMIPFYYGSKARSVPEYLKLRFDEKTRGFNAFSFAFMTIMSSGISMYALSALLEILLGWNFNLSLFASAAIVLVYTFLGGLTAAIYNEVLQFFLIVLGFLPLALLGLKDVGGWSGLMTRLNGLSLANHYQPQTLTTLYRHLGSPHDNPMGVDWFSLVFGLGFVLSFGYWCTDFLVVQRAMAANSMGAARRTPLIAAFPKMLFPFIIILPGMIAAGLSFHAAHAGAADPSAYHLPMKNGAYDYNMTLPTLLGHYFPTGMLGIGLTALMASFMSGMAGNVTAFNSVWTYDIYEAYISPGRSEQHYLNVGRAATIFGILASIGAAYVANQFNNIMDLLQLVFGFVNAPLFATFALGMFWRRSTGHGAFTGLLCGTLAAAVHHGVTLPFGEHPGVKGGWLLMGHAPLHVYDSGMAQSFVTAAWAFGVSFIVTLFVSLATTRTKTDDQLRGLVYSLTPKIKEHETHFLARPAVLGVIIIGLTLVLSIIFW
jgi:solute:Na+ symporter, SSS family